MILKPNPQELDGLALFKGIPPKQMEWLAERMHCRTFSADANIITVEMPGEAVYIVLDGTLKVHIEQAGGQDVVLAILGPGDTVGEMSLLDSAGRSASVVTLEETTLLWIDRTSFQEAMQVIPTLAINLVRILSSRVRLANEQIQTLATLDVYGRMARQLLAFAEKYGETSGNGDVLIPIRLTQGDFADLVGASRKRVNQVMVSFKNYHYISVDHNGHIMVHDRASLAKFC
ncbi:MAG TPA: Crp/Fnr family transcriptional regulator [Anaerolineales bacterium]|nr:Crp/Fnr family transcriptional regulator [Anaerolineales bacterium]